MTAALARVELTGITGCQGVAVAPAYVFKKALTVRRVPLTGDEAVAAAVNRFEAAVTSTRQEIEEVQREARARHGDKYAALFDSHLLVLEDPMFKPAVLKRIRTERLNPELVVAETIEQFVAMFANIQDDYLRERAIDMKDVGERLLRHLLGIKPPFQEVGQEPFILVAEEVTPSELIAFSRARLRGVCLDSGGATSHVAILAGAIGIPAVFGLANLSRLAETGDRVLIDSRVRGLVVLHPTDEEQAAAMGEEAGPKVELAALPTVTRDGRPVSLAANISRVEELVQLAQLGIDRVGLFRSEFMFMESADFPTERYQEEIYRQVTAAATGGAVLRTLDIGADKPLKYLPMPKEANPAMGWRSIRFSLSRPALLLAQLRAMLRAARPIGGAGAGTGAASAPASAGDGAGSAAAAPVPASGQGAGPSLGSTPGPVRVLVPMVSHPGELAEFDQLWRQAVAEVGPWSGAEPSWGAMVEVPAALFMMDAVARYTRYISIGTNDLLQFTFAADRTNQRVDRLADPLSMPFVRLLRALVAAAHADGITVGVCGEMAGDPCGFAALLGLGIDEFSMKPASLARIKPLLGRLDAARLAAALDRALGGPADGDLRAALTNEFPDLAG